MMRAIYDQRGYVVGDDLNVCVLLDETTGEEQHRVPWNSLTLIVDPTDDQLDAAQAGRPIPPESCAICHANPRHEPDWGYRTADGYGVCDTCGEGNDL
jgi:hypothetical protein